MPDPTIQEPNDAIVRITTTNICGSDLRTYEGRTPAEPGFIFGHEDQVIVEEVDDGCAKVKIGDRVSMPFNLGCGFWFNCERGQMEQIGCVFVDHSKGDAAEQIWEMSGGDWVQKSVEAVGYPGDPQREPEALYWKAVAAFEISGDRDDLIAVWETLLDRCPDSEWAKKASYVRG